MSKKKTETYAVRYNSDPRLITDDHLSDVIYLTSTDVRYFTNLSEAITFLCECVSPITEITELVPELNQKVKFDYILPESHIRPKHQLMPMCDMEVTFTNYDGDWSRPY